MNLENLLPLKKIKGGIGLKQLGNLDAQNDFFAKGSAEVSNQRAHANERRLRSSVFTVVVYAVSQSDMAILRHHAN